MLKLKTKITALEAIATRSRVNLVELEESVASVLFSRGFVKKDPERADAQGEAVVLTEQGIEHYRKIIT